MYYFLLEEFFEYCLLLVFKYCLFAYDHRAQSDAILHGASESSIVSRLARARCRPRVQPACAHRPGMKSS